MPTNGAGVVVAAVEAPGASSNRFTRNCTNVDIASLVEVLISARPLMNFKVINQSINLIQLLNQFKHESQELGRMNSRMQTCTGLK